MVAGLEFCLAGRLARPGNSGYPGVVRSMRGRFRDVHPLMYVLAVLLILFYAVRTGG